MEEETNLNASRAPIILGMSFLKTSKTKINVDDGTMSMKFGDITTKFNIFYVRKYPMEDNFVFQIDFLSELVDETYSDLFSAEFL